jgi:tetratricopeptide (TPR) repeat protein
MNALEAIDKKGEVTRIASEAQIALEAGDTARAGHLFRQAAKMLEASVLGQRRASERDLVRFLAATHYYKGGAYDEAAKLCRKIQERLLPTYVRGLYPPFLKDVKERSAPDYVAKTRNIFLSFYQGVVTMDDTSACRRVLVLLVDHPFLFPQDLMAFVRAKCCEALGRRRAASLFYRDAWRFGGDNSDFLFLYLASLCIEERHPEAWAIVEDQLANHPSVRSLINAILVRGYQYSTVTDQQERRQLLADQLRQHFESALEAYRSLGAEERVDLAPLMDFALSVTWDANRGLEDADKQLETLNRWIELQPDSPALRVLRGILTYPEKVSNEDFRVAIRLGSAAPWPHHFLAHEALIAKDFWGCDRLCALALQRDPKPEIRATLLAWQAISRWNLGHYDPREIRELFAEAKRLKPGDPQINHYAEVFDDEGWAPNVPPAPQFEGNGHWRERAYEWYAEDLRRKGTQAMSQSLHRKLALQRAS